MSLRLLRFWFIRCFRIGSSLRFLFLFGRTRPGRSGFRRHLFPRHLCIPQRARTSCRDAWQRGITQECVGLGKCPNMIALARYPWQSTLLSPMPGLDFLCDARSTPCCKDGGSTYVASLILLSISAVSLGYISTQGKSNQNRKNMFYSFNLWTDQIYIIQ